MCKPVPTNPIARLLKSAETKWHKCTTLQKDRNAGFPTKSPLSGGIWRIPGRDCALHGEGISYSHDMPGHAQKLTLPVLADGTRQALLQQFRQCIVYERLQLSGQGISPLAGVASYHGCGHIDGRYRCRRVLTVFITTRSLHALSPEAEEGNAPAHPQGEGLWAVVPSRG